MDKERFLIEDMERQRKIEKKLKNEKRMWWFDRRYLGRTLIQWGNLYLGLFLIITTFIKYPTFSFPDLFLLVLAGFNIAIWFWGGIMNAQDDFIKELIDMHKKILKTLSDAVNPEGETIRGRDYEI